MSKSQMNVHCCVCESCERMNGFRTIYSTISARSTHIVMRFPFQRVQLRNDVSYQPINQYNESQSGYSTVKQLTLPGLPSFLFFLAFPLHKLALTNI